MTRLGVNIDHVANIREARKTIQPDPIAAAVIVELAGADGITVHLRQDRRHIQDRDLRLLREIVQTRLNLEMCAEPEMIDIALAVKPDMVTLVPEKPNEVTTEGGLDIDRQKDILAQRVKTLQEAGIPVSIFIDPDLTQVKLARKIEANYVELHTGLYAAAKAPAHQQEELERIRQAAKLARKLNLGVNAGHDLTYRNVVPIVAIEEIEELNIGHNIVARAVFVGLEQAVREMLALIRR
ncbi:MAG: pyridoxine 5'-phosphate synthase [bacterium]|nr:pyridoxine 5'-phosphate synthase [bacterium]